MIHVRLYDSIKGTVTESTFKESCDVILNYIVNISISKSDPDFNNKKTFNQNKENIIKIRDTIARYKNTESVNEAKELIRFIFQELKIARIEEEISVGSCFFVKFFIPEKFWYVIKIYNTDLTCQTP